MSNAYRSNGNRSKPSLPFPVLSRQRRQADTVGERQEDVKPQDFMPVQLQVHRDKKPHTAQSARG